MLAKYYFLDRFAGATPLQDDPWIRANAGEWYRIIDAEADLLGVDINRYWWSEQARGPLAMLGGRRISPAHNEPSEWRRFSLA